MYKEISSYNHNFGKVDNFKFISKISLEKTRDSRSGDSNKVIERLNEKLCRKKNHKNFYMSNHVLQVHKTYFDKNLNVDNVC